jgi:hypothetical protein
MEEIGRAKLQVQDTEPHVCVHMALPCFPALDRPSLNHHTKNNKLHGCDLRPSLTQVTVRDLQIQMLLVTICIFFATVIDDDMLMGCDSYHRR